MIREMHSLFLFFRMSRFNNNILSNIYFASIGSEVLSFARTISEINSFVKLSNRRLKKMQKQGNINP